MATPHKEEEAVSQRVQELAKSIDKLPERYIHKDSGYGAIDVSCPLLDVPVIDYSLLSSLSPEGGQELEKLRSALSSLGCFQIINHGMEISFLDNVHKVSEQFFALPKEEKEKYSRPVDDVDGYGNDDVVSDKQTLDWTDRLYFTVIPEDQRKLQYWPKKPEKFSETLHEYTTKTQAIKENILKAIAKSLNLEEKCFLSQLGGTGHNEVRFNFYPPCPWPDKILAIKPHADGSVITILLQDKQVEGLQIMKDDHWFRVPIIPYALFINTGELLEIMSNGIFKSLFHRVLTNSEKERITLAMFCMPEEDREVGPVDELINNERPRLYKNMKYNLSEYFQYYQQGKKAIDAAKI